MSLSILIISCSVCFACQILDEWFGRSVIRSCVKLSYDHAQGFIEQPDKAWTPEELPPISKGFTVGHVRERVLNLHKVSHHKIFSAFTAQHVWERMLNCYMVSQHHYLRGLV